METKLALQGAPELIDALRRVAINAPRELARALFQEAEGVMAEAKRRTPVDTGALRSSGTVSAPTADAGSFQVQLSFGGPSAPYGLYVHEDLEAHHPVGQAKFLESAALEAAPTLLDHVGRRVDLTRFAR
jgi:hypothetical protein